MRQASPARSTSSELSMLSRSPSPPPEELATPPAPARGRNGRFLRKSAKRAACPSPPPTPKKQRILIELPEKLTVGKKTRRSPPSPPSPAKPRQKAGLDMVTSSKSVADSQARGVGDLDRLPKEIRQGIYAYCLQVNKSVCVKECCGPTSTRRERASCRKHGDHCNKIGINNGVTPYDGGTRKTFGRFSILSVSRSMHEEASWVLYTQGSLLIKSRPSLQAYLSEKGCTYHRLPNLPANVYAQSMWKSAACFRNVSFELPWSRGYSTDDPVACIYRLYEGIALLAKAWDLQKEKSTRPCQVTVQLNSLFTGLVPFRLSRSLRAAFDWTVVNLPHLQTTHLADFDQVEDETVASLESLVNLVGRHGGLSKWKIVAEVPRSFTGTDLTEDKGPDEYDTKVVAKLRSLQNCCRINEVALEGIPELD